MRTDISATAEIGGFIGSCLVDSESGLMLASEGGGKLDLEAAAALNTQVVKAKLQAMETLGLEDHIDDILITLGKQIHLIRPLEATPTTFLYVALEKKGANLGMARMQVKKIEASLRSLRPCRWHLPPCSCPTELRPTRSSPEESIASSTLPQMIRSTCGKDRAPDRGS